MENLSLAEFTYDNTIQESTNATPFFLNYGFNPKFVLSTPDCYSCSSYWNYH